MRQETFVSVRDRPGMIPLFGVDVGTRNVPVLSAFARTFWLSTLIHRTGWKGHARTALY